MVDFRVNDGFPNHPKTLGMTHEAVGVWVLIGCWCARYLTDGQIPDEAVRAITTKQRIIDELERRHLITRNGQVWVMPDWNQYQRTRDQVEKQRARGRERLEKWRAGRAGGQDL